MPQGGPYEASEGIFHGHGQQKLGIGKEQNLIDSRAQMHYIARQVMRALENTFGSLDYRDSKKRLH